MMHLLFYILASSLSFGAISKESKPTFTLSLPKSSIQTNELKEQNNCAKIPLSAIYSAQSAYHLENLRFADSFDQVGYTQGSEEEKACAQWKILVHTIKSGDGFVATSENSLTGEKWKIDESKNLVQEQKGQR